VPRYRAVVSASPACRLTIGDRSVSRLGFGALEVAGHFREGPRDRPAALSLLRFARDRGVDLFDTADSYGPATSEELLAEALWPYENVLIATKGGMVRPGPGRWEPDGRPEHLRRACDASLARLKVDCIDLYQLHTVDPRVPLSESVGALEELRRDGKVAQIGLSNLSTVEQLHAARSIAPIASLQNPFNVIDQRCGAIVDECAAVGLAFLAYAPLAHGLPLDQPQLLTLAGELDATPSQTALAWLLHRSPAIAPIPGTTSLTHLCENVDAIAISLSDGQMERLTI